MRRALAAVALTAVAAGMPGAGFASAAPCGAGDFLITDDRVTGSWGPALIQRVDLPEAARTSTATPTPSSVTASPGAAPSGAAAPAPSSTARTAATAGRAVPWALGAAGLVAVGPIAALVSRRTRRAR